MEAIPELGRLAAEEAAAGEAARGELYRAVPGLVERDTRRDALSMQRTIHNRQPCALSSDQLDRLYAVLPTSSVVAVARWVACSDHLHRLTAMTEQLAEAELSEATSALVRICRTPAVSGALALANPALVDALERVDRNGSLPVASRLTRSCVGYVMRAAVKPSPFSSLTTVHLGSFTEQPALVLARARRLVTLSPAVSDELLQAIALHPPSARALRYQRAGFSCVLDGRPVGVIARSYCRDGFFWVDEQVVRLDAYDDLLSAIDGLQLTRSYTWDELDAATRGNGKHIGSRLVELGLVTPVAPWSAQDPSPPGAIADAVAALPGPQAAELTSRLRQLDSLVRSLPVSDATSRGTVVRDIRKAVFTSLAAAQRVPAPWVDSAPLVYEDVETPSIAAPLGASVRQDLEHFGELLRPRLYRTALYDALLEHFVGRYGVSGICHSPLEFLTSFMSHPGAYRRIQQAVASDRRHGTPSGEDPASVQLAVQSSHMMELMHKGLRPGAVITYQLHCESRRPLVVLNRVASGWGGIVARFLPLLGDDDGTRQLFRHWVNERCPTGSRILELTVASEVNGLQRPSGLFDVLAWPTNRPTREDRISLDDLLLIHDKELNSLVLQDRCDRPVQPVYLGAVPTHMVMGPLRLLLVLADPWELAPLPDSPWPAPGTAFDGVRQADRIIAAGVVIRRRRWLVSPEQLPLPETAETPLTLLRRADQWRKRHDMPEEVFATIRRRTYSLEPGKRKPIWVSFASPHSLAQLKGLMGKDTVGVELVEALPDRRGSEMVVEDGPRTVEYVSMLAWERGRFP